MGSGPTELTARGLRRLAQARRPRRWLASSRAPKLSSSRISMERLKAALGAVAIVAAVAWAPWASRADCPTDNAGLTLPAGFCATVFADNLGHPRHIAVAPNGIVYVNTWSGRYYGNDQPPPGGFLVALRDTTGDGRADVIVRFGDSVQSGGAGGTGIALYHGALYAEANDKILRYALPAGAVAPTGAPDTIVQALPLSGDHPMHPFAIDSGGGLYMDLGSASNSCQLKNRIALSPGHKPCTELETRGGIWRYDANRTGQRFSRAERYATGIRNAVGIAVDASGSGVYSTQHGRDQLAENWPSLYQPQQGANLPAEELLRIERGADYGWPECYYDDAQGKLVLAPEYGGNGGRSLGPCATKRAPVAGLAVGPDGALYITDDAHGRIWRVTYTGATRGAVPAAAPPPATPAAAPGPPEGIHADAAALAAAGITPAMITLGDSVYHGQVGGGTCVGCHGPDAKGRSEEHTSELQSR